MYRESLQNNRERILLSKKLATIDINVPIEFSLEQVKSAGARSGALKQVYKEMEFFSLLKELGRLRTRTPAITRFSRLLRGTGDMDRRHAGGRRRRRAASRFRWRDRSTVPDVGFAARDGGGSRCRARHRQGQRQCPRAARVRTAQARRTTSKPSCATSPAPASNRTASCTTLCSTRSCSAPTRRAAVP